MEIFVDGGIFEILIVMLFAASLNFIFVRRHLLILFSVVAIASPGILFFIDKGEIYFWLLSICTFNSILLVILLWKEKRKNPSKPLFDVQSMKDKLTSIKNRISIFSRNH